MAEGQFSPVSTKKPKKGLKLGAILSALTLLVVIAFVISSDIQLPQNSVAQSSGSKSDSRFPVVLNPNGEYESPFVGVVEKVKNAVVNVSAQSESEASPFWWNPGSRSSTSSGSGFFFREDGYILTNNHVVSGSNAVKVRTSTGYEYDAEIVGMDKETDLAVLKVSPQEKIVTIPFGNSDELKVGDWAIAIGNPFPQQGLDRTVTVGVISAKGRSNLRFGSDTPQYQDYIQTDASINPGNSGGPLLSLKGEAIGVNAAISSPTGTSVGIGFAIPINLARSIVPDLIAHGKASRGWLGVWFAPVTEKEAKRLGLKTVEGVIVDKVFENSPAERAGLKSGDVIVGYNNHTVDNTGQLSVLVSTTKSGQEVPIDLYRDGQKMTVNTVVTDRDEFFQTVRQETQKPDDFDVRQWYGMELIEFTSDVARALDIKHINGIYVRRVDAGSAADKSAISRGTIILQIDEAPVETLEQLAQAANKLKKSSRAVGLIVQEPDGTIARKVIRP
ncbi:MAG: trypsin-like peptidase domain-containing protein [Candidatus Zixiibacteriota bacterium]